MRFAALAGLMALVVSPVSADKFDDEIEKLLKDAKAAGCAIAVSEKGRTTFAKGYGFANLEHRVKMRPDHVHELASVSKQFTAVSILQLVDAGKLKLDDSLDRFFDGAPESWKKVQISHLLNHTSGLPDYLSALGNPGLDVNDNRLVSLISDKPLVFEPGSKWEYSNSGYMMLGLIVAKVSGLSFGDYMQKHLFDPAGMKTAAWNDTRLLLPNRADGYSLRSGVIVREPFTSSSLSKTGDGQVMASALDLLAWAKALDEGRLLKPATAARMNEICEPSKQSVEGETRGYGFGVMLRRRGELLVQQHGGGWMGTRTHLIRYIKESKTLVILGNSDSAPIDKILALCEDRFLGKRVLAPKG
ncbi:MAG TPA: serine hydrolase domain-containing protein [Fimbriimonadaceae bacterium]|nr:serine hydrolase domain-containing protein [Fimbriimonadaceae bacterium]